MPDQSTEIGYDESLRPVDPADKKCVAWDVTTPSNTHVYYLLRAVAGLEAGQFYDPAGELSTASRYWSNRGTPQYKRTRVPLSVWKQYLNFLRTRNKAHLRNAERGMFNG